METVAAYYRQGRQLLNAAVAAFPDLDPTTALIELQKAGGPLDPSSVLVYRASLRRIALVLLRLQRRTGDFGAYWLLLDAALTARKAKIGKQHKRTSAKKVKDATEAEAAALFAELKRHALRSGNFNAVLAGLFTLVAGHSGFRPVELIGAELIGTSLTLPNAKRRGGQAANRCQQIGSLHEDVRIGLGLLLGLIDHDMSRRVFRAWEKCLAGQMRRACERISIRRLSLYSFRHIAIATWARAGLSPEEIARLCGHTSVRTAHTHYARSAVGHKRKAVVRAAASPLATDQAEATNTEPPSENGPMLDFDDMPEPRALPRGGPEPLRPAVVAARLARFDIGPDINSIAERIRKAQERRLEAEKEDLPYLRDSGNAG